MGHHHLSGHPVQCLTALSVNNFFLISNLNLPSFSLKPLPLVLSKQTVLKSPSLCYNTVPGWFCFRPTIKGFLQLMALSFSLPGQVWVGEAEHKHTCPL